ncbi:MAG TPA: DUF924 family protein [Casimicrobiaceae bacterium]|nr:DUF924 family protein [Casimicrobiaceae bacterium]
MQTLQDEILDFWFGPRTSAVYGQSRPEWFRKNPSFDAEISGRFGAAIETALAGGFTDWSAPRAALARVLLLDQFTRNSFRNSARAFAGDPLALATAEASIARGNDRTLIPVERWFMYLPFEHSEDLAKQERAITLCTQLRDETGLADPLVWVEKHAAVIRRFGRFPHRNAVLGRESTPEEIDFLARPGSRF